MMGHAGPGSLACNAPKVHCRRFTDSIFLRDTEFTVAVVSIDLDKANLSMESHKTLGFTILDSFWSD